jgi:light-regulated signal transduction histidine kinase (bacteriophytochrome)
MAELTRRVVDGRDFSLRAPKTTRDEIGQLAEAFNVMLAEIGRRSDALEQSNRFLEREMAERQNADAELRRLNEELERRVTERTSQLEAANKELEGFSYSVSHDLRAPLRAVVGFSKMLIEDHAGQIDEEAQRKLGVIQSEAQRMGMLIDDLLAFSRLGRKEMSSADIDMTGLARSTYEGLQAHHEGAPPEFRLESLPRARGDRVLLGQVWANLLSNALKFSSKREKPLVEVNAVSDEKEHIYFVRDNGAGFDPRYQSKLFGVFQRLHNASEFPGTGVGLALVQRIVVRHGGRVWADSRPGEGATFYFSLPKGALHGT